MISIKNVRKAFAEKKVLNGLDLEIPRGETLVIMGRSGCGKSVLLKIIAGLLSIDGGEVWVDGTEITTLKRKTDESDSTKNRYAFSIRSVI